MRLLPTRRSTPAAQQAGQTLGRGMDFALVVLVFLGIGSFVDGRLGTGPWFTVGLVVFSVIGQFVKMYYEYTATMERLEAERRAGATQRVA